MILEITIKTDNEKEFREVINFLKKEKIEVIKSSENYKTSKKYKDFKVMEEKVSKLRYKIPENYKFDREDANKR